jgi:hypothetical protein
MKTLRAFAVLAALTPAVVWAQGVRVGPALAAIPGIVSRATQQRLPERFPEQWQLLESMLERDRVILEEFRGKQLSGTKAVEVSNVIDDVDRIRKACLALEKAASGDAFPPELLKALGQTPAAPTVNPPAAPTPAAPPPANPAPAPVTAPPRRQGLQHGRDTPPVPVKPVPAGPVASAEEIAQLESQRNNLQTFLSRPGAQPAPQQLQTLTDAEKLLSRARLAGGGVSPDEISAMNNSLRAADPCVESERKADWIKETGNKAEAVELFKALAKQDCVDPSIARNAQEYVRTYKPAAPVTRKVEVAEAEPTPSPAIRATPAPPIDHVPPVRPFRAPNVEPRGRPSGDIPRLGLDVWQSAWGNFSELGLLGDYAKRNSITAINLNPGRAVTSDTMKEAYLHLRPLVATLRSAGVREINYLYAELGYPIANYAQFLKQYPDLGIGTIVDDSEFTDDKWRHFEENLRTVRASGLKYSAFITLESIGNSGVSDEMRFWAVDHIDQPILMSYFGCTFEEQRDVLEKYLIRADAAGHAGTVRIAILLGGKSVGRERSCEQQLPPAELRQFLSDIDVWARQHPSYGGVILETNLRLPKNDVGLKAGTENTR